MSYYTNLPTTLPGSPNKLRGADPGECWTHCLRGGKKKKHQADETSLVLSNDLEQEPGSLVIKYTKDIHYSSTVCLPAPECGPGNPGCCSHCHMTAPP